MGSQGSVVVASVWNGIKKSGQGEHKFLVDFMALAKVYLLFRLFLVQDKTATVLS